MKTTISKALLVKLAIILLVANASAQNLTGTRIDVRGARFSDQMWLFSVATCTYGYDNGWDGYKMFGTPLAPQLFAIEPDGYYQIDVVPDVNNTYLGFLAGMDTLYTFTFTHQNLAARYQSLYLIDSVANKTIDIYQSGTTYAFSASATPEPIKRFKIVTSLPTFSDVTQTNTVYQGKINKLLIYSSDKNIYIENPGKQEGKIKILNAGTGRIIKILPFNNDGTSIINANIPAGVYLVVGTTQTETVSTLVLIR